MKIKYSRPELDVLDLTEDIMASDTMSTEDTPEWDDKPGDFEGEGNF